MTVLSVLAVLVMVVVCGVLAMAWYVVLHEVDSGVGYGGGNEEQILTCHNLLQDLCNNPHSWGSPNNLVQCIENVENELQRLKGEEVDRTKHTHWNKIEGCTCEQEGRLRVIDNDCAFHGGIF